MFIIIFLIFEAIACYSFFFWKLRNHPNQILNGSGFLLGYSFFTFLFGWTQSVLDYLPEGFLIPFLLFVLLGSFYNFLKKFIWEEPLSFISESLFILGNLFLGAAMWMSFGFIFEDIAPAESYPLAFSVIGFILPVIMMQFWQRISEREEPSWSPLSNGYPRMKIENYQTVTFIITKHLNSAEVFRVTVRAPIDQPIKKIFHYLLIQMKEKDSITYPVIDDNWRFYFKKEQWWQTNKLLNFEENMVQNDIVKFKNIIILAKRIAVITENNPKNIEEPNEISEKNEPTLNHKIKPNLIANTIFHNA